MILIKNILNDTPVEPWDARVGIPSVLASPFGKGPLFDRNQACDCYEKYFYNRLYSRADIIFLTELGSLKRIYKEYGRLNLFCRCAPERCHAETIRDYILDTVGRNMTE